MFGFFGFLINWGLISGVGIMERESVVVKLLIIVGLGFIDVREGKL